MRNVERIQKGFLSGLQVPKLGSAVLKMLKSQGAPKGVLQESFALLDLSID